MTFCPRQPGDMTGTQISGNRRRAKATPGALSGGRTRPWTLSCPQIHTRVHGAGNGATAPCALASGDDRLRALFGRFGRYWRAGGYS